MGRPWPEPRRIIKSRVSHWGTHEQAPIRKRKGNANFRLGSLPGFNQGVSGPSAAQAPAHTYNRLRAGCYLTAYLIFKEHAFLFSLCESVFWHMKERQPLLANFSVRCFFTHFPTSLNPYPYPCRMHPSLRDIDLLFTFPSAAEVISTSPL